MEINSCKLTKNDIIKIKKNLQAVVESEYGPPKTFKAYEYCIKTDTYYLPLYWASKNLETKIIPRFKELQRINNIRELSITPRPHQIKCMELLKKELDKPYGGGLINMGTGMGKSLQSMMIYDYLKLKMLVVVHTVDLMQQWKKTINKFLPDTRVGTIQGKIFDTKDKDIVIGMLHSISMKNQIDKTAFEDFGIVIYDEVQFLGAEIFSKALLKSRARYTFGLSATIERQDGLEWIFKAHIGDIIYSNIDGSRKQKTVIKTIYNTNPNSKELRIYSGSPNISAMITELSEDSQRTKMICKEITKLDKSRNILVLSERVAHLKIMQKILGDESGLFIGGMKEEDKIKSKEKRILLATYHIASVGFDHPKLNTLVFATPRSNITQAIGRIYRKVHEISPMIIDIVDTYSVFPYQYKKRKVIYKNSISSQTEPEVDCLFD
jgi:superfamily II DNA or RNA helicase